MALGIGYKSKIKIGKESSWGAPADVNSAEFIPFASESLKENIELIESETVSGGASKIPPYSGNISCSGGISTELTYQDLDLLIVAALGIAGNPTLQNESFYQHVVDLDEDVIKSFTVWIDKIVEVQRFDGCKVNKLTLKGEVGKIWTADFDLICKQKDTCCQDGIGDFGLSGAPRVLFKDTVFRIGPINEVLDDSHRLGIASFEMALDNKLKGDDRSTESGVYVMEPVRNDKREVSLKIKVPRYEMNTFAGYYKNGTILQAAIEANAYNGWKFLIELPYLVIADEPDPNISGAGIMPVELSLNAYKNSGNENMNVGNEMRITLVNKRSVKIW